MSGTYGGGLAGPPPGPGPGAPYAPSPVAWPPPPGPPPLPGRRPGPPLGAAHKPGAVPLRPLRLGDLLDGAFTIVRYNPAATLGSSVLVATVAMLVPVVATAVLTWTVGLSAGALDSGDAGLQDLVALVGAYGALLVGSVLQWLGNLLVTGMNAHVTLAAATGHRLTLAQAWAATRGKRWRLIGLTALLTLLWLLGFAVLGGLAALGFALLDLGWAIALTVVLVLAGVVVSCFAWVRVYYLAVPPLMLEDVGVPGALRRAWALTAGQFWRTFGIALLVVLMASIVGGIVSTPIGILGQVALLADPGGNGFLLYVVATALAQVVSAAIVTPFVTTVVSLQYLDQRIRREAFDVELLRRAGILAA